VQARALPPPARGPVEKQTADAPAPQPPAAVFRPYPAARLLAQCLALSLPLGVGGVDLVGRALWGLPAGALSPDQAGFAAALTEAATLAGVAALFTAAAARPEGGVRLPRFTASLESVGVGVVGAALGGLAAAVASVAVAALTTTPLPAALESAATAGVAGLVATASPGGVAAFLSASTALAPCVEELLYRGLLLPALLDGGLGRGPAVVLAAAAFAASHAAVAPSDVPALAGLGLVLGWAALAGGGLAESEGGAGRERGGEPRQSAATPPVDLAAPTLGHALYNAAVLAGALAGQAAQAA